MLDETGHLIVEGFARQNILLSQLVSASQSEATPVATLNEIHEIVRAGEAANVFSIGDQINVNWSDGTNSYVLPFDIVHFADVTLQDGETVPGMYIQSHYAMQGVQFDSSEAMICCESALPAGTYHFTIGTSWGSHCVSGSSYYFTTTEEIPAGGQIVIGTNSSFYTWGAPDTAPANWRAYTFASKTSVTPLETLTLTSGTSGTDLGTLSSSTAFGANIGNLQSCAYGYNRYSHSAMRQYLNSSAATGAWWAPQHDLDRPPQQLSTVRGFMAGFDEAFLNILKPVKVRTALNTVSDSAIGTYEDTYDTFFPASLEQEYITPQLADTEGEYWEYWKRRLGLSSPQGTGTANANASHIRFAYENHSSAQYCRLRSATRGNANSAWGVGSTGHAYDYYATNAFRTAPACVIC